MKWEDGSIVTAGNIQLNTDYGVSASGYHFNFNADLQNLVLPPVYPITNLSSLKLQVAVSDIDVDGIRAYEEYLLSPKISLGKDRLKYVMNMLSPTSTATAALALHTNAGNGGAFVQLSLKAVPKDAGEMVANLNADIKAHMPRELAGKMVAMYLGLSQSQDPAADAQMMLDELLKQGVIVQEQNDYTLALSKKGDVMTLNGNDVSHFLEQVNMLIQ